MLTPEEVTKAKGHKLSANFTLYELISSANHPTSVFYPSMQVIADVEHFAGNTLQLIRNEVGRLTINSGYRNPILNSKVGGVANSVHQYYLNGAQLGQAADIVPHSRTLEDTFIWIIDNAEMLGLKTAIIYKDRGFIHLDTRVSRPSFTAMECLGKGNYVMYVRED